MPTMTPAEARTFDLHEALRLIEGLLSCLSRPGMLTAERKEWLLTLHEQVSMEYRDHRRQND